MRGMFNGYFLVMGVAGSVAMVLCAVVGRPVFAVGAIAVAAFAMAARRWFLQRLDVQLEARDAGVPTAVRQLRALHVQGMLVNALLLVAVIASVPSIV